MDKEDVIKLRTMTKSRGWKMFAALFQQWMKQWVSELVVAKDDSETHRIQGKLIAMKRLEDFPEVLDRLLSEPDN